MPLKYAYYPGCSLESTAREYDQSVRRISQALAIDLEELTDWNCCGASSGHRTDFYLSHALAGRNLAIAEKRGLDIATACPACFLRLKTTRHEMRVSQILKERLEELIGLPLDGERNIRHILDIVVKEVGLAEVKDKVKKRLEGLKLVAYYGCYLVRPPQIVDFDDPENPTSMDGLLDALGADVLDWGGKVDCCGAELSLTRREIAERLVGEIASAADEAGAEALVTACPLCQSNLEMRQGDDKKLPVFYFSELLGLALQIPEAPAWFKKHLVSPFALLRSHHLL